MTKAPLLFLAVGVFAAAADLPHLATKEEVLELAKRQSLANCSDPNYRCKYTVKASEEGWGVFVVLVHTDADGKQSSPVGGFWSYVYSVEGKLLREMPGL